MKYSSFILVSFFLLISCASKQKAVMQTYNDRPDNEEIFFIVEEMPLFQGEGVESFRLWIQQNLRYPEAAQKNGIQGRVFVQFCINSRGELVDAEVVRSVHPLLDEEALRVVRSSPLWKAGRQRGKPVKVQFTFPIVFVLQ